MPAQMKGRTRTGAREVPVAVMETDAIDQRMTKLDQLREEYATANEQAWDDYRRESAELWLRYRARVDGLTAEYQSEVDHVRAGT